MEQFFYNHFFIAISLISFGLIVILDSLTIVLYFLLDKLLDLLEGKK